MEKKLKLKEWRKEYVKTIRGRALKLINNARARSVSKNIEISLEVPWLEQKLIKNTCELTGLPFNLDAPIDEARRLDAPSLDRIDKKKGYTHENTRVVLWSVNNALGEYGTERILPILERLVDAIKKQSSSVPTEHTGESKADTESRSVHGAGTREDCDGSHHHRGEPEGEDSCDSAKEGCRICMGSGVRQMEALELYESREDYGLTESEIDSLKKLFGCICC